MIYGAGVLELGMTFSMEQLVIDNDIIRMTKKVTRGIDVNDETLGVAAIQKVGVANNFLSHKTTMNNIEYPSQPELFNRLMYGDWARDGSRDLATVAHEVVVDVMKNYKPTPIDSDLLKDMKEVLARADKEFKGQR